MRFPHLNFKKRSETISFDTIFDWKHASPDSCVHLFENFYFQKCGPMSFAPQPRALFQHVNFDKVFRKPCALPVFAWKCASRNNGVQFSVSHTTRWLRSRRLSKPVRSHHIFEKHSFATFLPFRAPWSSFYWLLLFSHCSHHCCCICPQVESLISKLLSFISLFCHYYFPILALLFPNISPYYFPIISLLLPYNFPITSLLCLFPYSISVLFSVCRFDFAVVSSLIPGVSPLGRSESHNRYDLGMLYLLVIHL